MRIKTIITDDHKIFRDGLSLLLESIDGIEVAGEASNGVELVELINSTEADLLFTDIKMPVMGGVEAVAKIKEINKEIKIIGITSFDDANILEQTINVGFDGLLIKNANVDEVKMAIQSVMSGGNYFSQQILHHLVSGFRQSEPHPTNTYSLSERELEVLELICKGESRKEIAEALFISEKTVDKHKENLIKKTETKNAVDLALFAYKNNFFDLSTTDS